MAVTHTRVQHLRLLVGKWLLYSCLGGILVCGVYQYGKWEFLTGRYGHLLMPALTRVLSANHLTTDVKLLKVIDVNDGFAVAFVILRDPESSEMMFYFERDVSEIVTPDVSKRIWSPDGGWYCDGSTDCFFPWYNPFRLLPARFIKPPPHTKEFFFFPPH